MAAREDLFRTVPKQETGFGDRLHQRANEVLAADISYNDKEQFTDYEELRQSKERKVAEKEINTIGEQTGIQLQDDNSSAEGFSWQDAVDTATIGLGAVATASNPLAFAAHLYTSTANKALNKDKEKPTGYGITDYGKDALFSLLKGRDETNINSNMGDILYNIAPKIEDLQWELDYLDKVSDAEAWLEVWRTNSTPEYNQEYQWRQNLVDSLTPEYNELIQRRFANSGISQAIETPGTSVNEHIYNYMNMSTQSKIESATRQLEEQNTEVEKKLGQIKDWNNDIWDREHSNNWLFNHMISDYYKQMEENTPFEFFNVDSWAYAIPGTLGSSFATIESQGKILAYNFGANIAKTAATRGLTKASANPWVIGLSELAIDAWAVYNTIDQSLYARERETFAELYESYSDKVFNQAAEEGIDIDTILQEGREYIAGHDQAESLERLDEEKVRGIIASGAIPTSNDRFNQIRKEARTGLDHQYYQNMLLSGIDIAQAVVAIPFVGSSMKSLTSGVLKGGRSLLPGSTQRAINTGIDNVIDFNTNVSSKLARIPANTRAFGKNIGGKVIIGGALTGLGEAYEEGNQYIASQRYLEGKYEGEQASLMKAMWDNFGSSVEATKAMLGLESGLYTGDDELIQNMKAGAMIGALMPLPLNLPKNIYATHNQFKVNNYVRDHVATQIKEKEDFAKARLYTDKVIINRQTQLLEAMEEMKLNLPYGVTSADIDTEIARVKAINQLVQSPFIKQLSTDLGPKFARGTDGFADLIAMSNYMSNKYSEANEANTQAFINYETELNNNYVNNFNNPLNLQEFGKFIYEKNATSDLIYTLELNKEDINKLNGILGTTLKTDKIDDYITRLKKYEQSHDRRIDFAKEAIKELDVIERDQYSYIEDSVTDDFNFSLYPKDAYQQYLLTSLSNADARINNNLFRGTYENPYSSYYHIVGTGEIIEDRVNKKLYTKLDNATKKEFNDQILAELDKYYKNVDTAETIFKGMEDMATDEASEVDTKVPDFDDNVIIPTPESTDIITEPTDETGTEKAPFIERLRDAAGDTNTVFDKPITETESTETAQAIEQAPVDDSPVTPTEKPTLSSAIESFEKQRQEVSEEARAYDQSALDELWGNTSSYAANPEDLVNGYVSENDLNFDQEPQKQDDVKVDFQQEVEQTAVEEPYNTSDELTERQLENERNFARLDETTSGDLNELLDNNSIPSSIVPNVGDSAPIPQYGLTSNTFYYNIEAETPLLPGYKTGAELGQLLAEPGKAATLEYEYIVMEYGAPFKFNDPSTYDNAAIILSITDPETNSKYGAAMKTPQGARTLHNTKGTELAKTNNDIEKLTNLRNKIIEAYIEADRLGEKAIPTGININNGLFNNNRNFEGGVVNRPINEVKGFNIPEDLYTIDDETVKLGVGSGVVGNYAILSKQGIPEVGKGGSGKIFIYTKNTPSGKETPIKLNEKQFQGDGPVVDMIYDLLVNHRGNGVDPILVNVNGRQVSSGFTPETFLRVLVNHGPKTVLSEKDAANLPWNITKQVQYDFKTDTVQFYNVRTQAFEKYSRPEMIGNPALQREFKDFLETLHWNMDKDWLWDKVGNTLDDIKSFFRRTDQETLTIPGVAEFTLEDVGLVRDENGKIIDDYDHEGGISWIAWYAKNGILQSDLKDQLFKNPFVYADDVRITETIKPEVKAEPDVTTSEEFSFADMWGAVSSVEEVSDITTPEIQVETTPEGTTETVESEAKMAALTQEELNRRIEEDYDPDLDIDKLIDSGEYGDFLGGATLLNNIDIIGDKINVEQAKNWLTNKLGLTEDQVIVTDTLINVGRAGVNALGVTRNDSIILYDSAVDGVQYHEAFHRVSLLLLNDNQRNSFYDSFRQQYNDYTSTDTQVEENLAEGFREWVASRSNRFTYKVRQIFNKILDFIGVTRNLSNGDIQDLYSKIESGYFRTTPVNTQALKRFNEVYGNQGAFFKINTPQGNVEFNNIPTQRDFYNIINELQSLTLISNRIKTINDVSKIDLSKTRKVLASVLRSENYTEQQKATIAEVYVNFDNVFAPAVTQSFDAIGIREVNLNEEAYLSEIEAGDVAGDEISAYDRASYEVSKKANSLLGSKIFMATMIKKELAYTADENGNLRSSYVTARNPLTGFATLYDFDNSWSLILNNLYDIESVDDMKYRVRELAEFNPFFYSLDNKFNELDNPSRTQPRTAENTYTQLLQTIKSHKHNFVYVGYNGYQETEGKNASTLVGFRVGDSNTVQASIIYPRMWSSNFYKRTGIVKNIDGEQKVDTKLLSDIIGNYQYLVDEVVNNYNKNKIDDAKLLSYKQDLITIFERIGIDLDIDTLNTVLNDLPNINDTGARGLKNFLSARASLSLNKFMINELGTLAKGGDLTYPSKTGIKNIKPLDRVFDKQGVIRYIAEAQAKIHPRPEEMSVIGAEGNLLYPIAQNNYMSDMTRWLNRPADEGNKVNETIRNLDAVTYNKNSLLLRNLKAGNKLQLNTFINFTEESTGDRGRDYVSISPLEDYISKMTLVANDHIILPTMADKKTYFTLTGTKLFHQPLTIIRENGKGVLSLGDKVLNQFLGYAEDEFNAIKQYYSDQSLQILDEHPERKVANYHTKNFGGRFRYFTGIWLNVNGTPEFTDFNKLLDTYEKNGNIQEAIAMIDESFFSLPLDQRTDIMNTLLKNVVYNEIQTAKDLGIINFVDNAGSKIPIMTNVFLDEIRVRDKINNYSKSSDPALQNNAQTYAIFDILSDYAVNSMASIIEFEKIFTKDPAYYKNVDDKIKRLGEVLSTGDNLRTEWGPNSDLVGRTHYNTAELKDNNVVSSSYNLLKELFTKANLRNIALAIGKPKDQSIAVTEQNVNSLLENPSESFSNYKEIVQNANIKSEKDVAGYGLDTRNLDGSINQTDASVYISPRMYRDIIQMLGDEAWTPEIERAFEVMEGAENWLDNPDLYAEAIQVLIKPLKMTYFGDNFDAELGLDVPKYDKMALFPLFRVLATGDNMDLYNRMTAQDRYFGMSQIDMVKFSSAVKVGNQVSTNFYKDVSNDAINDLRDMQLYAQEFKYLRRQLLTDPHTAERQMLGTQAAKGALSNLVLDRTYGVGKEGLQELTGMQIRDEVFGSMDALSNLGVQTFLNSIGDYVEGEFNIDPHKLSKLLSDDARQSGLPYDVLEGLQVINDQLRVPLSALSDSKWIESRIISLLNKNVIDINLPGGAFIQMSSFGFKSITPVSDNALNQGKKLNFRNPDGSMDAMVSINLFMHMISDEFKTDHVTAKNWLIKNNIIGANSNPAAMGYRIPTQGLSSIVSLKIVDVMPEVIGDTIVLPDEFTKLTGSDFDIDKLYVARYNYKNGKKVQFRDNITAESLWEQREARLRELDFDDEHVAREHFKWTEQNANKTKWDLNSREANENRLLDMYMTVLTDDTNVDETRAPLDNVTEYLKGTVLVNAEGKAVNNTVDPFYHVSPTFQLDKKSEYTSGKNGISPFALNNVHHVLTQLTNLKFVNNGFMERFNIARLDRIYDINSNDFRILDWLSAMINAHVDVAKDPWIIRLNVNQWTYNMTDLLLRTGIGENTFYFMPQQILKDMSKDVLTTRGRYGIDNTKSQSRLEREAIEKVYESYMSIATGLAKTEEQINLLKLATTYTEDGNIALDNRKILYDKEFLLEQLKKGRENRKDFDWYLNQILTWKTYEQLTPYAEGLSELVHNSQVDTKKFGNNFMLQKTFLYRVKNNIMDSNVFAPADLTNFFRDTFLDTKIRNSIILGQKLFSSQLLRANDQFIDYHNIMAAQLGLSETKNDRAVNMISNAIEASIKSQFFQKRLDDAGIDIKGFFYGNDTIASNLATIKSDILSGKYPEMLDSSGHIKNELLNYLDYRFGSVTYDGYPSPDFITRTISNDNDRYLQDRLKRYWQELLDSDHIEIRNFARELVDFAFITSGDNFTMNGIFNLVPLEERERIGYSDFIRNTLDDMVGGSIHINIDDVYQNNWHNSTLVPDVKFSNTVFSIMEGSYVTNEMDNLRSTATLPGTDLKYPLVFFNSSSEPVGVNSEGQPVYRQYVKYNIDKTKNPATTVLYKWIGNYLNDRGRILPVYKAIHKKGLNNDGIVITEYNGSVKSDLDFNNLPYVPLSNLSSRTDLINLLQNSSDNEFNKKKIIDMLRGMMPINDFLVDDIANRQSYEYIMDNVKNDPTEAIEELLTDIPVEPVQPENVTIHSGGAIGSDTAWETIGREFGINNFNHYYHGAKTPNGNVLITEERFNDGKHAVQLANQTLHRKPEKYIDLLARNWQQVANSDQVVGIIEDFQDKNKTIVKGGTGWAVQMAVDTNKPTFIFNQADGLWYTYDSSTRTFVTGTVPTITENFAGIGTRNITDSGREAIRNVYEKSFGNQQEVQSGVNENLEPINVYAGTNENAQFSNFAQREFSYNYEGTNYIFGSVEQAFHFIKAKTFNNQTLADRIYQYFRHDPASARKATSARSLPLNNEQIRQWDSMSTDILYDLMRESFEQNPDAANALVDTGNAQLTHKYNGIEQDRGRFSRLLTDVRNSLRNDGFGTVIQNNIIQESGNNPWQGMRQIKFETDDGLSIDNLVNIYQRIAYYEDRAINGITEVETFLPKTDYNLSEEEYNYFTSLSKDIQNKLSDLINGDENVDGRLLTEVLRDYINNQNAFVEQDTNQLSIFNLTSEEIQNYKDVLETIISTESEEAKQQSRSEFNAILESNDSVDTKENKIRNLICRNR